MTELVFIVCLALAPQQCEERVMTFTDVTPSACAMGAQAEMAKWIGDRPGWRVARWRCDVVAVGSRKA
jgi:hypothetical protein